MDERPSYLWNPAMYKRFHRREKIIKKLFVIKKTLKYRNISQPPYDMGHMELELEKI